MENRRIQNGADQEKIIRIICTADIGFFDMFPVNAGKRAGCGTITEFNPKSDQATTQRGSHPNPLDEFET